MNTRLKQLLTVLLSICVVLSFSSVTAFAGDGDGTAAPTVDSVLAEIDTLSNDPREFTAADTERVEGIQADYDSLSANDQATVDKTFNHPSGDGQSYGRILEAAVWAVRSYGTDTSTTLADANYTTTTDPAVSSQSDKGKSDSSRTRNWWVESVKVENGKATAYIYVTNGAATASKSTSYPSVWVGGQTIERDANNNYAIPVDLNGTTYFGGVSSSMPRPIMYSLSATIEEPAVNTELEEGTYLLSDLKAGPSAMFNHFLPGSKKLVVSGDTATIRFITDGSTASIQKYTKIALGKSSELLNAEPKYQETVPAGTTVIEGVLQQKAKEGDPDQYLFEVPLAKSDVEALLNNETDDDVYITLWNKEGSSTEKKPGWYRPDNDIYLSLGNISDEFGFTLQVGQYNEGTDFHTASLEGVTYELKDADGHVYQPSNVTTGMLTYSKLPASKTYTFTATKEGWTVTKQGKWDVAAHAYEYIFTGKDEISVTITKDDAGKNITDDTNPGMVFRKKPRPENDVDRALKLVPKDLSLFTEASAAAVKEAADAADPTVENEETLAAMAEAVTKAVQGLIPLDGEYMATATHTGNGMFKIIDVISLNVQNGKMSLNFVNGSKTYTKLYVGTVEEANAAQEGDLILPEEEATASNDKAGYRWIVPVNALETEVPLAAYSSKKSTFNSTGNFLVNANSLKKTTDLTITNNTGMFKAETASLEETSSGEMTLVMALSGTGYHELYKGTYEQAVENGDGTADKGNDTWIHGYVNGDGKWEFRIPVAAEEDGKVVPVVAVSDSYYQKSLNGQNELARAFYPRQFTFDKADKTLVTGDYEYSQDLAVTNNISMFKDPTAKLDTVGGPNSNNYKADMVLTMQNDSYKEAFVGTYAEAVEATSTIKLTDELTMAIPVKWVEEFGKPETLKTLADGNPFYLSFKSKKGTWYERVATLDEKAGTLVLDPSVADYSAVDTALATVPEDLSVYTDDSAAAVVAAVEAVGKKDKFKSQQAEVDAMAEAIVKAVSELEFDSAHIEAAIEAAQTKANEAKEAAEKADKSRKAAEEAAKTPGTAAVNAAKKAREDAEAAQQKANEANEAAAAVKAVTEKAVAAAQAAGKTGDELKAFTDLQTEAGTVESEAKAIKDAADQKVSDAVKAEKKAADDKTSADKKSNKIKTEQNKIKNIALKKVKVKKGKKKITASWKKNTTFAGYQITVVDKKTKKTVKTVKVGKNAKKKVLTGLQKKTKYSVTVRGYRTVEGTDIFGKAVTRSVKTK